MCAKAKETHGGLDKESLVQSRVFPVERWSKSREKCVENRSVVPRVLEGRGKMVTVYKMHV